MIEALKSDELVTKAGGRFRLCALLQRRVVQLMDGERPLVGFLGLFPAPVEQQPFRVPQFLANRAVPRRLTRLTRDHSVLSDREMTLGQFVPIRASHPMGAGVTRPKQRVPGIDLAGVVEEFGDFGGPVA